MQKVITRLTSPSPKAEAKPGPEATPEPAQKTESTSKPAEDFDIGAMKLVEARLKRNEKVSAELMTQYEKYVQVRQGEAVTQ